MDQFLRVVNRQRKRTSHCPQLSKLIETLRSNSFDVLCKCQFRVKSDSQAGNTARRDDRMSLQEDGCCCVDLRQLLTHASPHDLCLVGVEFQSIRHHPAVQFLDAVLLTDSQRRHSEVGPLNPTRGLGSGVSSPSVVWGGHPAKIEFGAF